MYMTRARTKCKKLKRQFALIAACDCEHILWMSGKRHRRDVKIGAAKIKIKILIHIELYIILEE